MRRIVTELASYLAELARAVVRGWNAFFFSAADPTSLGLIRVAIGLLAVLEPVCPGAGPLLTISARRAGPSRTRSGRSRGRCRGRSGFWCPTAG